MPNPDSYAHPDLAVQRLKRDGRFSDEEARDITERAAQIQSQSLFRDESGLSDTELENAANRAGISDAALEQAIKEREVERQNALEARKQRAAQKSLWTKRGLIGGAVFLSLGGLSLLGAQNSLGPRAAKVEAAQSQVDNVLERRYNLIPNLIAVTKSTLDNQNALIQNLQSASQAAQNARGDASAETRLNSAISDTLIALRTDKDASPVVLRLQDEMAGSENRIAVERRKYNMAAAEYNRAASGFPNNMARRFLGYRASYPLFQASEKARETPRF